MATPEAGSEPDAEGREHSRHHSSVEADGVLNYHPAVLNDLGDDDQQAADKAVDEHVAANHQSTLENIPVRRKARSHPGAVLRVTLIMAPTNLRIPAISDIRDAAARIAPFAVVTPLLSSPALDEACGGRVLLKAEVLQHTGSFKLRGALNRLLQLSDEERSRGVVAYSSGNHAQAVAYSATLLGMPSVIVMPADAPALKIERTRAFGAEVVLYDRYAEDRVSIGTAIATERGATIVPPFEDPHIVAGQGTIALEALAQAAALGAEVDALLVCCGGGGLTAGCALAAEAVSPSTRVHPCEPADFDDTARSLELGYRVSNKPGARSICDAIVTETPGEFTFSINQPRVGRGLRVTDDEVLAAIAFAVRELKLVVEPGGAAALAAALSGKLETSSRVTMVVVTGGNIDPAILSRAVA